tara:strand:- start:737 stop:850 length:114 start_codon:yes stop_codon:yes gene_type:complete
MGKKMYLENLLISKPDSWVVEGMYDIEGLKDDEVKDE